MTYSVQDKEYLSKALNYTPVIKDTWQAENEIGDSEGTKDLTIVPSGTTSDSSKDDPFKNTDARQIGILNKSTAPIALNSINIAISSLNTAKNKLSSVPLNYKYTLDAINHSIVFWRHIKELVNWFNLSDVDIQQYKDILDSEDQLNMQLGNINSILTNPNSFGSNSPDVLKAISDFNTTKEQSKKLEIAKDSTRTRCFMGADINNSAMMYSADCDYICHSIATSPDGELEALKKSAQETFLGLSKEDVISIGDAMYGELMDDIIALKRVANTGTDEFSVVSHINNVKSLATYKMDALPKMKHVMRNNQTKYDFTNLVINDMFNKCTNVDKKYKESLVNTIKYMHAENTILLKTFVNETRLNRFQMSPDYINS